VSKTKDDADCGACDDKCAACSRQFNRAERLTAWLRRWDATRVSWSDGDKVSVVLSKELRTALAGKPAPKRRKP
jgi:endonuclease YncB( thermonuclease family)